MPVLYFYCDRHDSSRPLLRACEAERPEGVVLLTDCDLAQLLRQEFRPLFDTGIPVRWIGANHEVPSHQRMIFFRNDITAMACGAKFVIHGRHHHSYSTAIPDGLQVCLQARAECFRLTKGHLP